MPALTRRFSFSKGAAYMASSPMTSAVNAGNVHPIKPKGDQRGPRSRRSSTLKRTVSFPAATASALIARAKKTKGGNRGGAKIPEERGSSIQISGLSDSAGRRRPGPPEMTVASSIAYSRLTTFFTAVSVCPSTKAIFGDHRVEAGKILNHATALTPCASVMAVYSGMMGGFGSSAGPFEPAQASSRQEIDSQPKSRWSWSLRNWRFSFGPSPTICNQETINYIEQPSRGNVSPWLTTFQIFAIMLLTVNLYRNMEFLLGL
ncbi:hypothetical protein NP233_g11371 [Leucocoprinus birnbaumii]|uniref:Uncharacterized protein n=1 Tax=Leucocoprinus birnbaumii TaxID=56174 RepID=A0AAD5VH91_9AGAR|nr:hypothetical protein NP233_g11371 [Leucocoprinus birnbaumii]